MVRIGKTVLALGGCAGANFVVQKTRDGKEGTSEVQYYDKMGNPFEWPPFSAGMFGRGGTPAPEGDTGKWAKAPALTGSEIRIDGFSNGDQEAAVDWFRRTFFDAESPLGLHQTSWLPDEGNGADYTVEMIRPPRPLGETGTTVTCTVMDGRSKRTVAMMPIQLLKVLKQTSSWTPGRENSFLFKKETAMTQLAAVNPATNGRSWAYTSFARESPAQKANLSIGQMTVSADALKQEPDNPDFLDQNDPFFRSVLELEGSWETESEDTYTMVLRPNFYLGGPIAEAQTTAGAKTFARDGKDDIVKSWQNWIGQMSKTLEGLAKSGAIDQKLAEIRARAGGAFLETRAMRDV